jgi:hypothetical protein
MRLSRSLAFFVLLAVLLPALAVAVQLCAMGGCTMERDASHDCCPPPATSLQVDCCPDEGAAGEALPPRAGSGFEPGALALRAQAEAIAPPSMPSLASEEPPHPAAGELLARACVLRI